MFLQSPLCLKDRILLKLSGVVVILFPDALHIREMPYFIAYHIILFVIIIVILSVSLSFITITIIIFPESYRSEELYHYNHVQPNTHCA